MTNGFRRFCIAMACLTASACYGGFVIDHRHTDITELTAEQITRAKDVLHIAYGHTSHGSQLTDGMSGLVDFANSGGKGLALPANVFAWNDGGTGGALDLHDYAMEGDVGYYPDWVNNTISYLNDPAHSSVNVIIWSWCGQMPGKFTAGTLTNEYLAPMSMLETSYPDVVFVYMTGHVDIWSDADQKAACQAIRDYCAANNKVLYDFADIEHYDPDGNYYEFVDDYCSVYTGAGTGLHDNWATNWQGTHTQGVDWYDCGAAHSLPLNANQKAYAAWALWCMIAADLDGDGVWDFGCQNLGSGWRWLSWFGYYSGLGNNWIWHSQHGYEYVYSASTPASIFFWDYSGLGWLWTSSTLYPYLYRFSDGAWLWYQQGSTSPRWFSNLTAGHWESH